MVLVWDTWVCFGEPLQINAASVCPQPFYWQCMKWLTKTHFTLESHVHKQTRRYFSFFHFLNKSLWMCPHANSRAVIHEMPSLERPVSLLEGKTPLSAAATLWIWITVTLCQTQNPKILFLSNLEWQQQQLRKTKPSILGFSRCLNQR